jgi:hypothetical protein
MRLWIVAGRRGVGRVGSQSLGIRIGERYKPGTFIRLGATCS